MNRLPTWRGSTTFVAVALLSLSAPAHALEAYSQYTWNEGTPVVNTSSSGQYPYGALIYPVCVYSDVDLWAVYGASTDSPYWAKGLFPFARIFLYQNCYTPPGGSSPQQWGIQWFNVPPGELLIYRVLFYWTNAGWVTCTADSNWIANGAAGWVMDLPTAGVAQHTEYGSVSDILNTVSTGSTAIAPYPLSPSGTYGPCGEGVYDLAAVTYAWTGADWLGGTIYSGLVYSK